MDNTATTTAVNITTNIILSQDADSPTSIVLLVSFIAFATAAAIIVESHGFDTSG